MSDEHNRGIIAWFVNNPVAANLLVFLILIAGFLSMRSIERELLPLPEEKFLYVTASYPTASPKEVEEGITIKIEDAIKNIKDIKKVQSSSSIGVSTVRIEVEEKADVDIVLNEVKAIIDTISTFPKDTKDIFVRKVQPIEGALLIQLHGDLEETQAKKLAEEIKRELLATTMIKRADVLGTRSYEVSIEIADEQLQKYKTTLRQVADRIRLESVNLPAGAVKTANSNILVRVNGQAYRRQDFENIALLTTENGAVVRVRDVAEVKDAYVDLTQTGYFDGKYSVGIGISAVGDQDVIEVAKAAKEYVRNKEKSLPEGVHITDWLDVTYYLDSRLHTMTSNLVWGGVLVFLLLILFMDLKIAFWVIMSIPVSVSGAFILMSMGFENVTLNMVSMFGFIMIVGIVIDDSIVVAESVDDEIRKSGLNKESVIRGTKRVASPAIFGVLTSIAAFSPMLLMDGPKHSILMSIGFVVIACLVFSLMESKWALPSHLVSINSGFMRFLYSRRQDALQQWMNKKLSAWIQKTFMPFVVHAVEKRYITLAIFLGLLLVTLGAVRGGVIKYELFPAEPNDFITANFGMAQGVSDEEAVIAKKRIEDALYLLEQEYQQEFATDTKLVSHLFSFGAGPASGVMLLELTKAENRQIDSFAIAERWHKKVGDLDGMAKVDISGAKVSGSRNLSFMLVGPDKKELEAAATDLLGELEKIKGVYAASHTIEKRRQEYVINLKPLATSLNLTLADIALQVKEGFYGIEVQRIQRDNENIPVFIRFPSEARSSLVDLESMHVRVPDGRFLSLKELADVEAVYAESNLTRVNGENVVFVVAKIELDADDPRKISDTVIKEMMPGIFQKYPSVSYRKDGISLDEQETEQQLQRYFIIVLMVIYILLAIPLKSYTQPLIIMSAIPFGIVGAVWGHWLLGFPISVMSLFGILALSGIIVNDTLVLIDFVNTGVQEEGLDYKTASIRASGLRFRAILLTTLTTTVGDLPMIMETSLEARSMIPMAISLGIGILFAIAIILILAPCLYVVLEDIKQLFASKKANSSADI